MVAYSAVSKVVMMALLWGNPLVVNLAADWVAYLVVRMVVHLEHSKVGQSAVGKVDNWAVPMDDMRERHLADSTVDSTAVLKENRWAALKAGNWVEMKA